MTRAVASTSTRVASRARRREGRREGGVIVIIGVIITHLARAARDGDATSESSERETRCAGSARMIRRTTETGAEETLDDDDPERAKRLNSREDGETLNGLRTV